MRGLPSRRATVLAIVASILVATAYSRGLRRLALGDEFRYVPRESVLLIAIGDAESLWTPIEAQLAGLLRGGEGSEEEAGGMLSEWLGELAEGVEKAGFEIRRLDDLERLGLDTRRGILLSLYRTRRDDHERFVAVLPVSDRNALVASLGRFFDVEPRPGEVADARTGEPHEVTFFDELAVAFPQPGLAVLGSSEELLVRSLSYREENLRHASNDDGLYRAVRRTLNGPLLVGPALFAFWETRSAPFGERAAALRFEGGGLRLEADVELAFSGIRSLEEVLEPSRSDPGWSRFLPASALAVLTVQDERLVEHLRFAAEELEGEGLPEELEQVSELRRLVLAVTDFEDGLPDFLVGSWGDVEQLEGVVSLAQRELRQLRDQEILQQALAQYLELSTEEPTLERLERQGLLAPEELFARYEVSSEGVGQPELFVDDFAGEEYTREYRGHRIRFLVPAITDNDLRYLPFLREVDRSVLTSDRYRMATVVLGSSLWVGSDPDDVERLIDVAEAGPGAAPDDGWPADGRRALERLKMRAFLDLDRASTLVWLNPETPLTRQLRTELSDLAGFTSLSLDLSAAPRSQRLHLSAELRF